MKVRGAIYTVVVLCLIPLLGYSQPITVTGQAVDKYDRTPVFGVYISVKNDSVSTTRTDENGHYTINAKPNDILVFSFIGYNTQEVAINGRTAIDVEMDCEDCGRYLPGKDQRQAVHDFSILATYGFNDWSYGIEYAYLPQIYNTQCLFNRALRYTDLNLRIQNVPHSGNDSRFFPHLRIAMPFAIPLFTSQQKLYPFFSAGYYFDSDFKSVSRHGWGLGGGLKTRLAFIDFRDKASRFMAIYLTAGYTAFFEKEKKHNVYLGLRFYLSKAFTYE